MNVNCVLHDPYFDIFSMHDVERVRESISKYFKEKYNLHMSIERQVVEAQLEEAQKYVQPITGDIYTRCILSEFAPDQFYGKDTLLNQVLCTLIKNVEYDLFVNDDYYSVWSWNNLSHHSFIKTNERKPPTTITMKY